jgi:hypothetical protein
VSSIKKREDGKWRARYRDQAGREHSGHFTRKIDGQRWIDETTAAVLTGRYVGPEASKTTVSPVRGGMAGDSGHPREHDTKH